jgi:hypothetical protein
MKRALLIGFSLLILTLGSSAQCLEYEPSPVSLVGTIVRRTYPGRPNYESIKKGDEPERIWVIQLVKAICVSAKDENEAESNQSQVQLVLNEAQYKEYRNFVGKKVTVSGTLFHGHTGHHHKKLLIMTSIIKPYKSR